MREVHIFRDWYALKVGLTEYKESIPYTGYSVNYTDHSIKLPGGGWVKMFTQNEYPCFTHGLRCDKVVVHRGVNDDGFCWEALLSEPHSLRIIERHI